MSSFAQGEWRCYWIISFHTRLGRSRWKSSSRWSPLGPNFTLKSSPNPSANPFLSRLALAWKSELCMIIASFSDPFMRLQQQQTSFFAMFFVCCFTAGKTRYRNFHPYHAENSNWPWHRFSFHRVFFVVGAVVCFAREWERNFLIFDSPRPLPGNSSEYHFTLCTGVYAFVSIFPKWQLTPRSGAGRSMFPSNCRWSVAERCKCSRWNDCVGVRDEIFL